MNAARDDMPQPARSARLCIAVAVGMIYGSLTLLLLAPYQPFLQANDFTYPWLAARAIWAGRNPYAAIQTAVTPWGGAFFYPLPAALIAMPVAHLNAPVAGAIFIGTGAAILAFVLSRRGWWPLILFLSASAFHASRGVQWSPLLTASAMCAPLLGLVAAKPNLALPLFAFQRSWRRIVVGLVGASTLLAISFAVEPHWLVDWTSTLQQNPEAVQYRIPLLYAPVGGLMALALLRWRRPEARLLFCMACMPQNGFFYDQLPLFLIPARNVEMAAMAAASDIAYYLAGTARAPGGNVPIWSATYYPFMLAGVYAPALFLILTRPNHGRVAPWLDRLASRLPAWIRGRSTTSA